MGGGRTTRQPGKIRCFVGVVQGYIRQYAGNRPEIAGNSLPVVRRGAEVRIDTIEAIWRAGAWGLLIVDRRWRGCGRGRSLGGFDVLDLKCFDHVEQIEG